MGISNSSGGKGSANRPLSVAREVFSSNFDAIFGKKTKDPVKTCETYKKDGCSHVDGYLCDPETCGEYSIHPDEHPLSKLLAGVPSELYDNSTWVRDICHEANLVLVELDRLKKG